MTWHVADGAMQRAPLHDPDNIPCSTNHAPPVPGVSALPVQPPQQHRQPTCDPAPMTPPGDAEIYSCFLSRKRPCLMPDNRPLLPKEPSFAALHEVKDIRIHQILIRPDLWKIGISCPFVPELQWIFVPASNALQTNVLEQAFRLQISVALTGNHLSRQGTWPRDQTPSSLCLTVESCVFLMTNQHVEEIILCIPFCGGVSGWQHAVRFLQDQGFPIRTPLACDIAEEAVESFSLTHGFHPGCQEILTRPTACVADASQGRFWMAASSLGCNTATASWPCQSFSVAGGRQGWAAPGGQSFRDMLDFCRLSGIRFLLLENVPEVWNDLNLRATLIAAIHEAGFRFLFAEILKLEHVVPAQRSRFIGVAEKGGENSKWTIEQAMKVKQAFQGPDRCLQVPRGSACSPGL